MWDVIIGAVVLVFSLGLVFVFFQVLNSFLEYHGLI